jgi:hypothetical protein
MQIITMGKAAIFKSKISNILQKKLDWKNWPVASDSLL